MTGVQTCALPILEKNIALAMISIEYSEIDTTLQIETPSGIKEAIIVNKPFYDPKKKITASNTKIGRASCRERV